MKREKFIMTKAIDSERKTITGYASTNAWDRDGERFVKGAWDLTAYLQNPVVLWVHDGHRPPIGRNVEMIEDEIGLKAVTEFDIKDDFSMKLFDLYERKFLHAFSVGFIPKDYVMEEIEPGKKGVAIKKAELYEYSAVPIPANPGALIGRELAEMAIKVLGEQSVKTLNEESPDEFKRYMILPAMNLIDQKQENLFEVLEKVIELARVAKGNPLEENKKTLLMTAISVFNDLLEEGREKIDKEGIIQLKGILTDFSILLSQVYPGAMKNLNKTICQIERAVTGSTDS